MVTDLRADACVRNPGPSGVGFEIPTLFTMPF